MVHFSFKFIPSISKLYPKKNKKNKKKQKKLYPSASGSMLCGQARIRSILRWTAKTDHTGAQADLSSQGIHVIRYILPQFDLVYFCYDQLNF